MFSLIWLALTLVPGAFPESTSRPSSAAGDLSGSPLFCLDALVDDAQCGRQLSCDVFSYRMWKGCAHCLEVHDELAKENKLRLIVDIQLRLHRSNYAVCSINLLVKAVVG